MNFIAELVPLAVDTFQRVFPVTLALSYHVLAFAAFNRSAVAPKRHPLIAVVGIFCFAFVAGGRLVNGLRLVLPGLADRVAVPLLFGIVVAQLCTFAAFGLLYTFHLTMACLCLVRKRFPPRESVVAHRRARAAFSVFGFGIRIDFLAILAYLLNFACRDAVDLFILIRVATAPRACPAFFVRVWTYVEAAPTRGLGFAYLGTVPRRILIRVCGTAGALPRRSLGIGVDPLAPLRAFCLLSTRGKAVLGRRLVRVLTAS